MMVDGTTTESHIDRNSYHVAVVVVETEMAIGTVAIPAVPTHRDHPWEDL